MTGSSVNDQIIDSITSTAHAVGSTSTANSMSITDLVMAETISMGMHNAVNTQHSSQMTGAAAVTAACARIINGNKQPVINVNKNEPNSPVSPLAPQDPSVIIANAQAEAQQAIDMLSANTKKAEASVEKVKAELEQLTKDENQEINSKNKDDSNSSKEKTDQGKDDS